MRPNSRFVLATHVLTLLAHYNKAISSSAIARSAGVNPVTVRKIISRLRAMNLVTTSAGPEGGASLARPADQIELGTLFLEFGIDSVYGAFLKDTSADCIVGKHLEPSLEALLAAPYQQFVAALEQVTVADVLTRVRGAAGTLDAAAIIDGISLGGSQKV